MGLTFLSSILVIPVSELQSTSLLATEHNNLCDRDNLSQNGDLKVIDRCGTEKYESVKGCYLKSFRDCRNNKYCRDESGRKQDYHLCKNLLGKCSGIFSQKCSEPVDDNIQVRDADENHPLWFYTCCRNCNDFARNLDTYKLGRNANIQSNVVEERSCRLQLCTRLVKGKTGNVQCYGGEDVAASTAAKCHPDRMTVSRKRLINVIHSKIRIMTRLVRYRVPQKT